MRARIISGGLAAALVAGLLVAMSPAASADVGDATPFSLPAGAGSSAAIGASSTGDIWVGFIDSSALARVSSEGVASLVPVKGLPSKSRVLGIAQDAAGRIWFTDSTGNTLWSVTSTGTDPVPLALANADSAPMAITLGPDGNIWFTEYAGRVGRITPAGALSEFTTFTNPTGVRATGIATGTGDWFALTGSGPTVTSAALGTITTAGATKTFTGVVTAYATGAVAVTADGAIWVTANKQEALIRVAPDGTRSTVPLDVQPNDLATAPDGALWFGFSGDGKRGVGRLELGGKPKLFPTGATPGALVFGADGNIWATTDGKQVLRILSGIAPQGTKAPAVSSPAGSSNGTGTVLSVANGTWKFLPTTYAQQWQRCTGNDAGTCTDIPGANASTYTVTDADLGGFVRATVTASNLNGAGKPASSGLFQLAAKPAIPTQPTTPTPVAGGATVTVTSGVTATLTGPSSAKRKAKKVYRLTFKAPQPRGTVRFSLLDKVGTEVFVIADAASVKGTKKTAYASKSVRIPRSVAKGSYTLRAVYTPTAAQAPTYPITTLTKPITIR